MKKKQERLIIAILFALLGMSCGVKGPPLPPVADTPAASDREEVSSVAPNPSPTPFTPKKKSR